MANVGAPPPQALYALYAALVVGFVAVLVIVGVYI